MAKIFGFRPHEVDLMDKDLIPKLLWLEERWKEKENEQVKT